MSNLTNYGENKLVDLIRGQAWALSGSLYICLGTAADDGTFSELTASGYSRATVSRALSSWAGTQSAGTTLASSGTSHTTSNNAEIVFPTAGADWTFTHVGIADASSGGIFAWSALAASVTALSGDAFQFEAGELNLVLGATGGMTDYTANKLIDFIFRGQAFSFPATAYAALYTAVPTNAGGGTEVSGSGTGYARAATALSLANWAGTQGDGTTAASSGTGGQTSNNSDITFPTPSGTWGNVAAGGLFDASSGGNLLFYRNLTAAKLVNATSFAPKFAAGKFKLVFA